MKLEDWHTHSERCHHAEGSLEDYVQYAMKKNVKTLGFSDHFPYEFVKGIDRIPYQEYAMSLEEIEEYLSSAEALREKYFEQLDIKVAFEIDFFEHQENALNKELHPYKGRLDYILGSVHILDFEDERGSWGFDDGRFIKDYEHYGADQVYLNYYKTLQKMISSPEFDADIISHFDLPKKFGHFPTKKKEVFQEAIKTLELAKEKDYVVEINTSGLRKEVGEQYPSFKLVEEMFDLDIPILLGSDAHDPKEVAWEFESVLHKVKEIGYNQLAHFDKRKRSFIEL